MPKNYLQRNLLILDKLSSGDHWAFESEIFWKARGNQL
jgi:hypothetical protein